MRRLRQIYLNTFLSICNTYRKNSTDIQYIQYRYTIHTERTVQQDNVKINVKIYTRLNHHMMIPRITKDRIEILKIE